MQNNGEKDGEFRKVEKMNENTILCEIGKRKNPHSELNIPHVDLIKFSTTIFSNDK